MKILRFIIIGILVPAIVLTIISFFIPGNVEITKVARIYAPKDSVMSQLADPLNWKNWYPGLDAANDLVLGDGKVVGVELDKKKRQFLILEEKRENEITAWYKRETDGSKNIATAWTILAHNNSDVTIQWSMKFRLRWYPWEKFASLLFNKIYGSQMEKGLENLRIYLESDRLSNK
jgi:hypothetical protein